MKIKIKSVENGKGHEEEKVLIEVLEDCDIGQYAIFDTTYANKEKVSNKVRHTYWFPDRKVKAGDFVMVYTKPGTNRRFTNSDDTTTHVLHWEIREEIWNNDGDCAILLEIGEWEPTLVSE
jgi:hypothetical protein